MRKATLQQAEMGDGKLSVTHRNLTEYLGQPVFTTEELYKKSIPGVTWDWPGPQWAVRHFILKQMLFSRVVAVSNKPEQLGSVMQESSEIAYSYVRSLLSKNDQLKDFFNEHFVHLHVPAGATPKDGPSAGITMALALYSLATNKAVRKGLAMTGELTLTGKVLPIGGVREKTIAARRVKVFELIFPAENKKDFDELPDTSKKA
jgi:ATP-dependent Lon protease